MTTTTTTRTRAAVPARAISIEIYRTHGRGAAITTDSIQTPDGALPTAKARALSNYYAAAAKKDLRSASYHRVVAGVLARADRVDEPVLHEWNQLLSLLERHRSNPKATLNLSLIHI